MTLDETATNSRKDRFIAKLVAVLTFWIYRDIEVHWVSPPSTNAPSLSVSNHFGGVSDALILLQVLPRRPGIIARDVIWRVPVVGWFMSWIGAIPVHKPDDTGTASTNDQMFASCYDELRDAGGLLIFPEGVTRNEPSIAPVKTGAARIALGARASGARGIIIEPIGIHYEDKASLRSRVVVLGGAPIELDDFVGNDAGVDADDRAAVQALTDEIEVRLRRAAPDFGDWEEARALTKGAEIAIRSELDDPRGPVPIELRDRLANTLADRSPEQREAILEAVDEYRNDLEGLGLSDADVQHAVGSGRFFGSLLVQLLVGLLLLPFAIIGAIINVIPFLIVRLVGRVRVAPSVHATIKPLVALAAFGVSWGVVIWLAARQFGIAGSAAAVVLLPVYLAATIVLIDRVQGLWLTVRRHRRRRMAASLEDQLTDGRRAVVRSVLEL